MLFLEFTEFRGEEVCKELQGPRYIAPKIEKVQLCNIACVSYIFNKFDYIQFKDLYISQIWFLVIHYINTLYGFL